MMEERQRTAFLVARALLDRSRTLIDGTDSGEIGAVILYDLAVDTAGRAVAADKHDGTYPGAAYRTRESDREPRDEPGFPLTIDRLLASYRVIVGDDTARVSALDAAMRLHRLRNVVQHEGRVPSASARAEAESEAFDALQWLASAFYGRQLEEISRADGIASASVRACVRSAERRAAARELTEAIADLWVAFERAQHEFSSAQTDDYRDSPLGIRQAVESAIPRNPLGGLAGSGGGLQSVLEELEKRATRIQRQLEVVSLGDDASEYAWFERSTTRPWSNINGEWHLPEPLSEPTIDDFRRAYEFVVRTILRWQRLPLSLEGAPEHTHGFGSAYAERPYAPPQIG